MSNCLCERYQDLLNLWPREDRRGVDLGARTWISLIDIGEITEENIGEVFAGLERWKTSEQWRRGYIHKISTWLFMRAWKDFPPAAKQIPPVNGNMLELVRQYFGTFKIKGKAADEALISEVAAILRTPDAIPIFGQLLKELGRIPESWGYMVWAAERVRPPSQATRSAVCERTKD